MHAMTHPKFIRFKPWSHTNRRLMITVLDGIFLNAQSVRPGIDRAWMGGKLTPMSLFATRPFEAEDAQMRDTLLRQGRRPTLADQAHVAASWSGRAPKRLKIHSRRMHIGADAADWAEFKADLPENKGRHFFVLTLLDPARDTLSP